MEHKQKTNTESKTCDSSTDKAQGDTQDAKVSAKLKSQIRAAREREAKQKAAQEKAEKEAEIAKEAELKAQIRALRKREKAAKEKEAKEKTAEGKASAGQDTKSKTKAKAEQADKKAKEKTAKVKTKPAQDTKSKTKAKAEQAAKAAQEKAAKEAQEKADREAQAKAEQEAKDAAAKAKAASKKTKAEVLDKLKVLQNTQKLVNEFKKNQAAQLEAIHKKADIKAEESILDALFSMYSALKFTKNKNVTENEIVAAISSSIATSHNDAYGVMKSVMKLILREVPNAKTAFESALKEIAPTLKAVMAEWSSQLFNYYGLADFATNKIDIMSDAQIGDFIVNVVISQENLKAFNLKTFVNLASDDLQINVLKLKKTDTTSDGQKVTTYINADSENKIAKLSEACMAKFSTADSAKKVIEAGLKANDESLATLAENAGCTNGDWCKPRKSTWKEASNMDEFVLKGTNKIFDTICKLDLTKKPAVCAAKPTNGEYCSDIKTCVSSYDIDVLIKIISNSPTDSYFNE